MLVAYEDGRFYEHDGVDFRALVRAGAQWLMRGHVVSGGSTLPMQVARLIEPRPERTIAAKLRQIARALEIERDVGKTGRARPLSHARAVRRQSRGRARGLARLFRQGAAEAHPRRGGAAGRAAAIARSAAAGSLRPTAARAARDRVLDRVAARGLISAADAAAAKREPVPQARLAFPALAAHAAEEAVAADTPSQSHQAFDRRAAAGEARGAGERERRAARAEAVGGDRRRRQCDRRDSRPRRRGRLLTMPRATARSTCRARPARRARR